MTTPTLKRDYDVATYEDWLLLDKEERRWLCDNGLVDPYWVRLFDDSMSAEEIAELWEE